ncbi:hypothetical protein ACFFJY_19690 [Fictibacillus aquaticus]|uniref:Uncharacterized protein n=1 Tax=Fictibacillus aquaticus TaxID=2021314 RepID=A0A235F542_9BACL|nr:hypothetical protein [Fictibacillus aquaticus]OYD56380.1 hypothetical protein CGZ90_17655 [Fictibacillus aquaticus]
MAKIIPFPEPEFALTDEEVIEYHQIKELLETASTFRHYRILKKRVAEFMARVEERRQQELNDSRRPYK